MTSFPPFVRHGLDASQIQLRDLGIELSVLVPSAATAGSFCLIEERTQPGAGPPLHVHAHQDEWFYFQEGSYLLRIDDEEWRVGPGDVAVVPKGVPHGFANVGTTTGRFLFTLTPAMDAERFFQRLGDLLRQGPPDPDRINAAFATEGFSITGPPLLATARA
ncbi:MAG TPA: cupin domain-containing protein [Geminicoccus sp.]|jgi:uncharacterized cupin superfamily protein|uniref:cupin domain-containing protein n=1 Tax=Geminicoccus sp. TaxID=2024832 RepID=UPI002E2FD4D0|nr:cupin domain-containing protein [Geminicoccus sp.]HEX2524865.1 cupin domain-containing protein [Geminicoccus sp.]